MKYAIVAVAFAAVVRAQTLADIPECALPCIDDAIASESSCSTTDLACICDETTFAAIQGAATGCVLEACGAETALNDVLPATEALCAAQGGDGGSDTTTSEAAPETTTSEAAPETTTAAEVETTTAVETTTTVATTTKAPSTIISVTPTVTVAPPETPTSDVTVPTGAAAAIGPVGGLAMLGLAVLAL